MKIAVCVKQVPDTWAEKTLQASDSTLDREAADGVMNELDEYAVEEALKLAEAHGGEVVVVTMGPERAGETVRKGSLVRLNPRRRADAQDLFYADQLARVTAIHRDLDDETHVAVVLVDDPASDLHDWYGRYLYFSPDEVVPL